MEEGRQLFLLSEIKRDSGLEPHGATDQEMQELIDDGLVREREGSRLMESYDTAEADSRHKHWLVGLTDDGERLLQTNRDHPVLRWWTG